MPKCCNFRDKVDFIRRLGSEPSRQRKPLYKGMSLERANTAAECQQVQGWEFRTHDKVWWRHPGQIVEGIWLLQ